MRPTCWAKAPPWPQPHAATRQQHTQRQQRTLRHGRTFGPGHPIDRSHARRAGVRLRAPSAAPGCVKRTRRRTASCPRRGGLCVASSLSLDASYALRVDGHPVPAARGQARVRARPSSDGKRPRRGRAAGPRRRRRLASAGLLGHKTALECGCSSGVEHHVANVRVEGSNPFARSTVLLTKSKHRPSAAGGLQGACALWGTARVPEMPLGWSIGYLVRYRGKWR